ncbi:MAG: M13 family metallopeptidase [Thermoplasmata archaeon]|nr:M13 family metallopeptidase [Thermoplasmata archaeon]
MDRSVDPTVDFYQFAAGGWIKNNPVPPDKAGWSSFSELAERNHELIHGLLEECLAQGSAEPDPIRRLVGEFYASAMNLPKIEDLRFEPLRPLLDSIARTRSPEEMFRLLAAIHAMDGGGCFNLYTGPDEKDSSVYALYLVQGGLSLPDRDYYLSEKFAKQASAFREHLTKSFGLLGEDAAAAANSAEIVYGIEKELASASRSRTELRDPEKNYNKFTVSELVARCPHLPWSSYLNAEGLGKLDHVIVGQPEFFDALDRMLVARPLVEWRTYLRWHVFTAGAPLLHDEVEQADFEFFHRTLLGQERPEPRWLRAYRILNGSIGEAVGQLYVERYFPPEAKARMTALVDDLREVFRDRLRRLAWMTAATRQKALAKFDRFTAKIGHPDRYRDYSRIPIDPTDFFGNRRRASEFENRRQLARLGGPVDRTEWSMTPPTVNAYFNPTKNEIVFPAGVLQPPYFDLTMDDAVNFGGIGAVIAHEITHGFDDEGRKYGADGNLADWWTEADAKEFETRAAKVVTAYDGYEALPGARVNGALTLGENIADIGGLSIAFEALQRRLAATPSHRRSIDGMTPEQRFFIAWTQVWRENVREDMARMRLTVDPHAPGRARALLPMMNLPEFAEAFAIRPGSPLFRPDEQRVRIW